MTSATAEPSDPPKPIGWNVVGVRKNGTGSTDPTDLTGPAERGSCPEQPLLAPQSHKVFPGTRLMPCDSNHCFDGSLNGFY